MEKNNRRKRKLAWLMVFVMTVSLLIDHAYPAFAADVKSEETTESATELTKESKASKDNSKEAETTKLSKEEKASTEVISQKEEAAVEKTTTEEVQETATEAVETTTAEEVKTTEAPEVTTKAVETTTEEKKSEQLTTKTKAEETSTATTETAKEAPFSFGKKIDGVTINITAKEGVLPIGTTVTVKPISLKDAKKLLKKETKKQEKEMIDAVMFDVVLHDAEGKEIQPDGKVNITFSNLKFNLKDELEKNPLLTEDQIEMNAYRVQDDGKKITVLKKDLDVNSKKIEFKNDHFTPVGIALYANEGIADQLSNLSTKLYDGYKDTSLISTTTKACYKYPLYVDDDGDRIAYCYNESRPWPASPGRYSDAEKTTFGYWYQKVENATATDMNLLSTYNDVNMRTHILRTIYNGYPYDKTGLQSTYQLNDMQFRAVTQAAIWYYTDKTAFDSKWNENLSKNYITGDLCGTWNTATNSYVYDTFTWTSSMTNALNQLISSNAASTLKTPPDSFELDIYVSQSSLNPANYPAIDPDKHIIQNLLSTKIKKNEKPPVEDPTTSINLTAKKTFDGQEPGSKTFTFGLWRGTQATGDPIQTVTNDAQGNITFNTIDNVKNGDQFAIKEIVNNPDDTIQYDTTTKVVTVRVTSSGTEFIEKANDIQGYAASNGTLHITVDGTDLSVYCIFQTKPGHDGEFIPVINPTDTAISAHTQGGAATYDIDTIGTKPISDVLRKVLYYFSQHTDEKIQGKDISLTLNQATRQSLIWRITGGTAGSDLNSRYAIANIYKAVPTVPSEFNVVMFTSDNDKQPVITGFMPTKVATIEHEGTATTPEFSNTTKATNVSINVKKEWSDNQDQDGIRPNSVTVHLYADGVDTKKVVTLNEDNSWTASFDDLPKFNNKKEIIYSVKEDEVKGYSTTVEVTQENKHFKLVNTHNVERVNISGEKKWDDRNNLQGKRPDYIIVTLLANGEEYATKKVKATDQWTYIFEGMPKNLKGQEVVYTVKEAPVEGYTASYDGCNIMNKENTFEVEISKTDIGGNEIEGAKLTVTDKNDRTIDEWTSVEGENRKVKLQPGTYTLTETTAPKGYEVAESIEFSVDKDGKVTVNGKETDKVTMVDKQTSVKISKVDITDSFEVAGAEIKLLYVDENGKEQTVQEWVSTGKPKEITGLMTGVEYILRETVAPKGYKLTNDTTFTLDEKGKVSAGTTKVGEDGVLLIEDERDDSGSGKTGLKITKKLMYLDTGEFMYADNETFYVGVFEDEKLTKPVGEPKALHFNGQATSTVGYDELTEGKTYYFSEVDKAGVPMSGGEIGGVSYTADYPNGQVVTIVPGKTLEYDFENMFIDWPEGFKKASIKITKNVTDSNGNLVKSKGTFYAGIFSDSDYTELSSDVESNIIALEMNGTASKSVSIPVNIQDAEGLNLYIAEVDKDGNLVENDDAFAYSVAYENNEIQVSTTQQEYETTITNYKDAVEEEEEEEEEKEETSEKTTKNKKESSGSDKGSSSSSTSSKHAKTGDDSMTAGWLLLMATSLGGIVYFVRRRRTHEE